MDKICPIMNSDNPEWKNINCQREKCAWFSKTDRVCAIGLIAGSLAELTQVLMKAHGITYAEDNNDNT